MTTPASEDRKDMPLIARLISGVDKPRNVTRIFYVLIAACVMLGLADFLYHKHSYFEVEDYPLIYGVFGFVVYGTVIFLAKGLRLLVRRPENYYKPLSTDTEDERAAGSDADATGGRPHA